ncbi:MAG: hypothetical protein NTX63_03850 [Candidatus Peregrinibacteria bacterium]|nr:hypothetical protein [Candidatus Peregrinibacteria bacterium]
MKINIYKPNLGIRLKKLTSIQVEINGKIATHFERTEDNLPWPTSKVFSCETDNTYEKEFEELKLNHRFTFFASHESDDDLLANLTGYAHLNFFKKTKMDWLFKRHWLQKGDNVKWLIGVPLSIITALLTTWLANHFNIFG